jgi:hypothetical protein
MEKYFGVTMLFGQAFSREEVIGNHNSAMGRVRNQKKGAARWWFRFF